MARLRAYGPPPDVGHFRSIGLKALHIRCLADPCGHVGWKTYDELALPNDLIFIRIARYRHFVCSRCGKRQFEISADWRDHRAAGTGQRAQ